jgi:hypothetical protein
LRCRGKHPLDAKCVDPRELLVDIVDEEVEDDLAPPFR